MAVGEPRNPGPSWGLRTIDWWDAHLPTPLRDAAVAIGGAVAYWIMPGQRAASREYLSAILGRPATHREGIRHFAEFTHGLLAKLRAGDRVNTHIDWADQTNRERGKILFSDESILLGTFHVGASDLMGFHVSQNGRGISMIRQRVANSDDIDRLLARSGDNVEIIWVNEASEIVFALKESLEAGKSIAMQCDRVEHASKTEGFDFLGAQREFPVTIYRLACLYGRPVQFYVALPQGDSRDDFDVFCSELFRPTGQRQTDRDAAHAHFQGVLVWLEGLLREQPYQWFNFLPLNPVWTADTNAPCRRSAQTPPSDAT
ncbi:hypothetical protein [Cerasicoccus maritimus]|uniref:LpxL/LpxP family acyltransferase n=1 Tax=Cerasicoccus maritimus TaxID=490089 RepID=UPI002852A71D|nr:hypothetical protein [Cerasicoccus maritimus]